MILRLFKVYCAHVHLYFILYKYSIRGASTFPIPSSISFHCGTFAIHFRSYDSSEGRAHLRVIVTGRGIFRDFPEEGACNTITS